MRASFIMRSVIGFVVLCILSIPLMKHLSPGSGSNTTPPSELTTTIEKETRTAD